MLVVFKPAELSHERSSLLSEASDAAWPALGFELEEVEDRVHPVKRRPASKSTQTFFICVLSKSIALDFAMALATGGLADASCALAPISYLLKSDSLGVLE